MSLLIFLELSSVTLADVSAFAAVVVAFVQPTAGTTHRAAASVSQRAARRVRNMSRHLSGAVVTIRAAGDAPTARSAGRTRPTHVIRRPDFYFTAGRWFPGSG